MESGYKRMNYEDQSAYPAIIISGTLALQRIYIQKNDERQIKVTINFQTTTTTTKREKKKNNRKKQEKERYLQKKIRRFSFKYEKHNAEHMYNNNNNNKRQKMSKKY